MNPIRFLIYILLIIYFCINCNKNMNIPDYINNVKYCDTYDMEYCSNNLENYDNQIFIFIIMMYANILMIIYCTLIRN